jgi:rhodanese-related sulfurtransferase
MRIIIDRNEAQRLMEEEGALLIEVMPKETYDQEHIVGAINMPIKELNRASTAHLNPNRPIIVYCWDMQ